MVTHMSRQAMKHANLVQLFAVCTIGEPIFIITELMPHGCLLDYLKTPNGEALRLPTLIDMATDIAQAMVKIALIVVALLILFRSGLLRNQ